MKDLEILSELSKKLEGKIVIQKGHVFYVGKNFEEWFLTINEKGDLEFRGKFKNTPLVDTRTVGEFLLDNLEIDLMDRSGRLEYQKEEIHKLKASIREGENFNDN